MTHHLKKWLMTCIKNRFWKVAIANPTAIFQVHLGINGIRYLVCRLLLEKKQYG